MTICECANWCDKKGLRYKHHQSCPKYNPVHELRTVCAALIKGIECWAHDEDGVHDAVWEAYRQAKWMIEGKIVGEKP